ncbi:MAG TPA: transketolase C-terminal domain-containing protein [Conexibacter sp.]|nr:transketolase C-terminal domain-containing protein [Conexibacter sp.]
MTCQKALAQALRDEMLADPLLFVIGEDVRSALCGVTTGLVDEVGPERVIDTPISEQAFTSFGMGAALAGRRAVVEFEVTSLVYMAFDQIVNQAQKFSLMTGGQAAVPVTYVVPGSGARLGMAAQHSDQPYAFFVHAGVKTIVPSTAADTYGLFLTAMRDPDPVALLVTKTSLGQRFDVPDTLEPVPLGRGRIHREGSDVTVVAVGHLVQDALAVAEELADEVSVEVFDPRTLLPFDWELLAESVAKTGRLVVVDDTNRSCGLAAEVVATAAEEMDLRVPPRRVTRADVPIPFAVELEQAVLPSRGQLTDAIRGVVLQGAAA